MTTIADVADSLERFGERYLRRVHTPAEVAATQGMDDARRTEFLAGRFAAKEAVLKALRVPGEVASPWPQVEVVRSAGGWPEVRLHGSIAEWAAQQQLTQCEVTISHDDGRAIAFAMAW